MTGIQVLFLFQGNTESTCISRWARLFIYFVGGYNQLQNVLRIRCQNSNRGPWYEICVVLLERRKRNIKVTHTTVCIDVSQDQNLKNVWMMGNGRFVLFLSEHNSENKPSPCNCVSSSLWRRISAECCFPPPYQWAGRALDTPEEEKW